jgi:hypothetical protein
MEEYSREFKQLFAGGYYVHRREKLAVVAAYHYV